MKIILNIMGLPKTTNSNRGHWTTRMKEAKIWRRRVWAVALTSNQIPNEPFNKAKITCTRFSSGKCDFDGLVSCFKHCIDGLIDAGIIINDTMDVIGQPTYLHEDAPRGKGRIRIEVERVA